MLKTKNKRLFYRLGMVNLAMILMSALSLVPVSGRAFATGDSADDCLVTMPYQESIWSDPLHSEEFFVGVASKCEIKLYDMDVSFSDIEPVEGLIWFDSFIRR